MRDSRRNRHIVSNAVFDPGPLFPGAKTRKGFRVRSAQTFARNRDGFAGPAANQPLGLINVAGVHQGAAIDPANLHPSFCAIEKLIEDANVDMSNYGVLCSTDSKRILNSNPAFTGGSDSVWEKLRNPISSPEVTDAKAFAGCWNNMTFAIWGRGVELLVDQYTLALTGQVKIYASLFADVGGALPGRVRGYCAGRRPPIKNFGLKRRHSRPGDSLLSVGFFARIDSDGLCEWVRKLIAYPIKLVVRAC
jgi:hypothetical protein